MGTLNFKDYMILGILGIWLLLSLKRMYKGRKENGCMGCGHNCSQCNRQKNKK